MRLLELNTPKSQWYITTEHEFQTPLSQIMEMAQEIASDSNRWASDKDQFPQKEKFFRAKINEQANLILRNARDLLFLINQKTELKDNKVSEKGCIDKGAKLAIHLPIRRAEGKNAFLKKIIGVIEENLTNPKLCVGFLSRAMGLSKSQLGRRLSAVSGGSPLTLIRSVRIEKAKILLKTTQLTIAEIAYQTGFSDPNYFTRIFKCETNQCPTDFREH